MPDGLRIEGMDALQRALKMYPKATQRGAVRGMRKGVLRVQRAARQNAPVDTGRLRASIATRVSPVGKGVRGVVGSAVHYAPYQEFGAKPHWPPIAALETWARRHGTSAYLVARSIAQKGIKAKRYLRDAWQQEVHNVVRDMAREIEIEIRKLARG